MDDKNSNVALTIEDDVDTTIPNMKPDAWAMPEPVFRRTSGKLPQGFERNYGTVVPAPAEPTDGDKAPAGEPGTASTSSSYVEPTHNNPTVKIILVVLGLAAMIAFLVVFLTIVYFLFLR